MRLIAALIAAISLHLQPPHASTPPVDYAAAYNFYLHTLAPEETIRIVFASAPPAVVERMVYIASRESMGDTTKPYTFDCAADNKHSSAAGLFQTLAKYHKARAERMGLAWSDVAGPDCVADVELAFNLWQEQGMKPWS